MRALILAAGAALTLSACGGGDSANTDMNSVAAVDNTLIDQNASLGGFDGNIATNAADENAMVMNGVTQNDADTNLVNGM